MSLSSLLLAFGIGGSLGLVGGGGSILTVPALVYGADFDPRSAIAASLIVVGVTSAVGALLHLRAGTLDVRVAGWFGGVGACGAVLGGLVGRSLPGRVLMGAFAAIAVTAAVAMMRGGAPEPAAARPRLGAVIATALGVGFLTGLLGVGGGFLIVPALVLAVGLGMNRAVGTSLAVIALNCAGGIATSLGDLATDRLAFVALFTAVAVTGGVAGARASRAARPRALRLAFALVVLAVGLFTGWRTLVPAESGSASVAMDAGDRPIKEI